MSIATRSGGLIIRTMTRDDIDTAIEWAAREGWNPGLDDAECFHVADADGFLIGVLDDDPVATISVVRYGTTFGFLGLYIVKPECRGRGYGMQLWNAGLARLANRTVGLDGVVAQQDNYRKSGFTLAYRNIRYESTSDSRAVVDPSIVPLSALPFDAVAAYDRLAFPAERADFLRCWIHQPRGNALGFMRDGKLTGYGVIRPARDGFKIGPLFADDAAIAEALFDALTGSIPHASTLCLDVPEVNPAAIELAERRRMSVVFETARMYAGGNPHISLQRVFGVTTFELG
ncbi:MAG TPA: GNAT family N-acetyltransferase [Casimicrobiaceae bacterium]|nr:GNAT family N-acetyltransferase [Casimicrobiaceae bacterium]